MLFQHMKSISLLVYLLVAQSAFAQSWNLSSPFPSTERDDAISFKIGTTVFCGTGLKTGWVPAGDMYAFNLLNDTWSDIQDLPAGKERQYATAFSNDSFGFIFGGTKGSLFLNDLYCYDP